MFSGSLIETVLVICLIVAIIKLIFASLDLLYIGLGRLIIWIKNKFY